VLKPVYLDNAKIETYQVFLKAEHGCLTQSQLIHILQHVTESHEGDETENATIRKALPGSLGSRDDLQKVKLPENLSFHLWR
jgi:hypothetical protein